MQFAVIATPGPRSTSGGRSVRIRGQSYPVLLPSFGDSRLHVAATIVTLHVLGQIYFGFELAVSQVLAALLTCAVIEMSVIFVQARVIAWPASALLTGNGIAFLLRVPGTRAGDLWTWHGVGIYVAGAAVALLTKYLVRVADRPLFNPSNVALVGVFVILGSGRVDPLDLWWVPVSPALVAAYLVILVGGVVVGRRQAMLEMTAAFFLTFAVLLVPLSVSGHCMSARWALGDVCGGQFFTAVALSPELLIFAFFMITDPKSAPAGRAGRLVFGMGVATVAVLLSAAAHTEFWTKVAVLAALVVGCLTRPLLDRLLPAGSGRTPAEYARMPAGPARRLSEAVWRPSEARWRPPGAGWRVPGLVAGALVSAAVAAVLLSMSTAVVSSSSFPSAGDVPGPRGRPLPAVRLGPELAALGAGRPDQATAELIVRGVLGDLATQKRVPLDDPPVTDVELTVVRDASRPQDRPRLAVRITRFADIETYEVARRDGRYVVAGPA